jgi:hypothetical protein
MSEINRKKLGLYPGTKGVLTTQDIKGLPSGVVIESLFHRSLESPQQFSEEWKRHEKGAQILVGYWQRDDNGQWNRKYSMVAIPENYRPQQVRTDYQNTIDRLSDVNEKPYKVLQDAKLSYQKKLSSIAQQSVGQDPVTISESLRQAKQSFEKVISAPEIIEAKKVVVDSFTKNAPIAQKILLSTVDKTVEDRDTLLINLASSTITGGGTVAPIVIDNAVEASFEVLSEEGIITADQANVLQGASTLLKVVNGASNADDLLSSIAAVGDAYDGMVDIGIIDEDKMDDRVHAQIKSGSQALNFIIQLQN